MNRKFRERVLLLITPVLVGVGTWYGLPELDGPDLPAARSIASITLSQPIAEAAESTAQQDSASSIPPLPMIDPAVATLKPVNGPGFSLPVDCTPASDCFLQFYPDRDAGPDFTDFSCRKNSYNGHKGTDFRVPSLTEMNQGMAVLAAADGKILGYRDGMADGRPEKVGYTRGGNDCGNRVGIDHGNGWLTTYCHLRKDSVQVRNGEIVKRGDVLGYVGHSGNADFPHLHFSVQRDDVFVDPFAIATLADDCGTGDEGSLWDEQAQAAMPWRDSQIIQAGFALNGLDNDAIEGGVPLVTTAPQQVEALVVYGRVINLNQGYFIRQVIYQPDGTIFIETDHAPITRPFRPQEWRLTGRKGAGKTLMKGQWAADVLVMNQDRQVIAAKRSLLTVE